MLKCKKCGFENKDNSKFCKSCGKSLQEEFKGIQEKASELLMAKEGYFKGEMCPFVLAQVGGTHVATAVFTGGNIEEYTWVHLQCIKEYCKLWDSKSKDCSFKVMVELLRKK